MKLEPSTIGAVLCLTLLAVPAAAQSLPIVDAHSQFDEQVAPSTIIAIMDRAGVSRIILSARGRVQPARVAELARSNPDRIIAAIRTKGRDYDHGGPAYHRMLQQQVSMPGFQALAEVLLWHAKKGERAPEVDVALAEPQAQAALKVALDRKLPFIAHYEFRALAAQRGEAEKRKRLAELEAAMSRHRDLSFALIHMGQLGPEEAGQLLRAHSNLHLLTSHSNPITIRESRQPWTDLFEGERLASAWRDLILAFPDRFVLAFDNVWPEHWGDFYVEQVALWRKALGEFPVEIARSVAHRNAERLWRLPPAAR